jgi:hypothetical protein
MLGLHVARRAPPRCAPLTRRRRRAQVLLVRNAKQLGDGELAESEQLLKNANYERASGRPEPSGAPAARSRAPRRRRADVASRRARSDGGQRRVQGAGSAGARNFRHRARGGAPTRAAARRGPARPGLRGVCAAAPGFGALFAARVSLAPARSALLSREHKAKQGVDRAAPRRDTGVRLFRAERRRSGAAHRRGGAGGRVCVPGRAPAPTPTVPHLQGPGCFTPPDATPAPLAQC